MTETYSKSVDFPNGIAPGQLTDEINNDPSITTTLLRIDIEGDVVDIIFVSNISPSEKTALDSVVANHVPFPSNAITNIDGFIDLTTTLADGNSIIISASDPVGGINMNAGNGISIDSGAASNFTTSNGNLTLEAGGVTNVEGAGGINIGSNNVNQAINIGASASARPITIGNSNTTTGININTGTGGFAVDTTSGGAISLDSTGASSNFSLQSTGNNQDLTLALTGANDSSIILDSAGTGSDAIRLASTGGIVANTDGAINLISNKVGGGTITLDTSVGATIAGGITLNCGSSGILMTVIFGGLINIGTDTGTGNISIGTGARERTVTLGSVTSNSRTVFRKGDGGFIKTQTSPISLSDSNHTLTLSELFTEILRMTPSTSRTLTLPTAADIVSGISGAQVSDSFDFSIINESSTSSIILSSGTGGSIVGNDTVVNSASGRYRLRITNVTSGSEAYVVYRAS